MKTAQLVLFSLPSFVFCSMAFTLSTAYASSTATFSPFPTSIGPYYIGEETQISRDVITPSVFPILSGGMNLASPDTAPGETDDQTEYKMDANLKISPNHPKAYTLASRNFYYGERDDSTDDPLRFTFGRRLIGWSSLDENWNLGDFEPQDSWDRLRPYSEGLTGVFAFSETSHFNFRIFGSYLYLPSQSPNVVIDNGQFVSEHPQAVTTSTQSYAIHGHYTPIGYQIDIPSYDKILLQPSIAFSMETKAEIPFHAKFSYGYQPLNYFPVALVGGLALQTQNLPFHLTPILMHHHVYNLEIAQRVKDRLTFGLVGLVDEPVNETQPSDYTYTPLSTSVSISPSIEYQLPRLKVFLSQLWTRGGLERDSGDFRDTDPNVSIFSSHILYRNATQLAMKYNFTNTKYNPFVQLKYIHEYSIDANWIAGDVYINPAQELTLFVGGDVINASRASSPDRGAEFLADVQALDRVRLGVIYAF